ncbi:MAG: hypothetical protein DMH00_07515 [Acidobacteria bacterium]|nr:MAG: hypothetical protein DMH00_07515 [Acidobacteriota bacterium]
MNKFVWRLGLTLVVVLALFGRFSSGAAGEKTMSSQMVIIDDPPPGGGSNTTDVNCAALSDPSRKGLFSIGLMERMAVQCGVYSAPVGSGDPGTFVPAAPATDRLVNNSAGDTGSSTTQSETSIAVRSSDGRLCAGWNDSQHYANSPYNSFSGFGYSTDGGATWVDRGALPPITGHINYGDPDVDFRAADGKFYYVTIDSNGLAVHISSDGCANFTQHAQVHVGGMDDKELMAIDNGTGSPYNGRLYVVWTDFNDGIIKLSRSTDGLTWSSPTNLHPVDGRIVQGAWPTVAPNGNVFVSWVRWSSYPSGPINVEVVRSTDGGGTFTQVASPLVGGVNPRDSVSSSSSRCDEPALKGDIRYLPSPQIEADKNGVLHVVYSRDPDGHNVGDVINVYYRRSTDSGATWGTEVKLNSDSGTNDQFFPTLSVSKSGTIGVYWYDRRNDTNNLSYQVYRTLSLDGGLTWQANAPVSDGPSPLPTLLPNFDPVVAECYMGDYNEADADASNLYMIWSDNRNTRNGHADPDVWFDKETIVANPCTIDLVNNTQNCGSGGAITFVTPPSGGMTVLKVTLNPSVTGFSRAVFDVTYGGAPSGWTVNIGDSATDNGFGGDSATQSNDAEMQVLNTSLSVYGNDATPPAVRNMMNLFNAVAAGSHLTLDVRNNYLGFGTGDLRSERLYALAGQADTEGPVNYDIFAAFNRTVYDASRNGTGVTQVIVTLYP